MRINGHTRMAAVVAKPIKHSISPLIHNMAFEKTGVNGVYLAWEVEVKDLQASIENIRRYDMFGVNLSMPGCKSEVMLHVLEGDEVYISSGSACSKGKQSGVLKALGLPKARTDSALRVSFAPFNTKEDVDAFVAAVKKGAKMFRR